LFCFVDFGGIVDQLFKLSFHTLLSFKSDETKSNGFKQDVLSCDQISMNIL